MPLTRRGGAPFTEYPIPPVLLPVCGVNSANNCNAWLRLQFEKHGQRLVEMVLDGRGPLDTAQAAAFVRWWTKTLFLRCHPEAVDTTNARTANPGKLVRVPTSHPWHIPPHPYPGAARRGVTRQAERRAGDLNVVARTKVDQVGTTGDVVGVDLESGRRDGHGDRSG